MSAFIDTGAVRLEVQDSGTGKPVVLLHGFPECAYSWRHQIAALSGAGFRAIAPDQRGYNRSDKPRGVGAYRVETLAKDVIGLLDALGLDRVTLVGHDWGGTVAWTTAALYPERFDKLVTMNGPHPQHARKMIFGDARQLWRSRYMLTFQLPWLAERVIGGHDFPKRAFHGAGVRREAFDEPTLAVYREAIAQPGAATGMLNWYRAAFRYGAPKLDKVRCPTLVIWGDGDPALGPRFTEGLEAYADDVRVEHIPGVGHWVQQEAPERVNELLLAFLR
jgi:pimeloyl-ACP methyl ester carboxylesterase